MHFSQQQTRNQHKVQLQHLSTRLVLSIKVHKKKVMETFFYLFVCSFIHLVILHANHSFPSLLSACFLSRLSFYSPPSILLCLHSEGVRTPMGNQQSMAYSVEAGPSSSPLHEGWARHPTISKRFQKASTRGNSQELTRITPAKTCSVSEKGT